MDLKPPVPGAATSADYAALIRRLLPRGRIWQQTGTRFAGLIDGIAEELARLHAGVLDFAEEMDPRTASDCLAAWERITGMPQPPWLEPPATEAGRQALVHAVLKMRGGQSAAYFVQMAGWLGYTISVLDPVPEGTAGYDPATWTHHWIVQLPAGYVQYMRCDTARVGDRLVEFTDDGLRIAYWVKRGQPAHTVVHYEEAP